MIVSHLVPPYIIRRFRQKQFHGSFFAVSLFIDVSGFTQVTESLAQFGSIGAEILSELMMRLFDPMVSQVYEQDGHIIGFAGDACTALFPFSKRRSREKTYYRALAAAINIQQRLEESTEHSTPYGVFKFSAKLGLADGEIHWGIVRAGDEQSRHAYYFRGSAIERCVIAEQKADRGALIVNESVYKSISHGVSAKHIENKFWKVTAVTKQLPRKLKVTIAKPQEKNLLAFLPPEIVYADTRGEFRQVATLFISLKDMLVGSQLTEFMQQVFKFASQYRGFLQRLDFGDKGCTLLLFWGAPVSFENNLERAFDFILDLKKNTTTVFRAALTFRSVFAGFTGATFQGEYSCYGRGINLAARMMMSGNWGDILFDMEVAKRIQHTFEFQAEGSRDFKGFPDPQPVFRLTGRTQSQRSFVYEGVLVGRQHEIDQIVGFIQPIFHDPSSVSPGMVTVFGEPGMGKSRLIYECNQTLTQKYRFIWLECLTDEILRQSLNPFIYTLKQYFNQSPDNSEQTNKFNYDEQYDHLLNKLTHRMTKQVEIVDVRGELIRLHSLLAGLIGLRYDDSLYYQLDPRLRFENTLMALTAFFKSLACFSPVIIFIDDVQWLDTDSKRFLESLVQNMKQYPVAIICASRYRDDNITQQPIEGELIINLEALPRNGIKEVAENVLSGHISDEIVTFLMEKTHGNPFFVEQLTLSLQEQNMFTLKKKVTTPHSRFFTLNKEKGEYISVHIKEVLIARLDRLPFDVKHVVQTASVLGRAFELPLLQQMLKLDRELTPKLKTAVQAAVLSTQTDLDYIFKHALMRDAAYSMQLHSRLSNLHQSAADAIEVIHVSNLAPYYADLVYHFEHADNRTKTMKFLEKAGDYAKENYQNIEALDFYDRLITYYDDTDGTQQKINIPDKIVEILIKKIEILRLIGRWKEAVELLLPIREQTSGFTNSNNAIMVEHYLGSLFYILGDYSQAMVSFEKCFERAQSLDDKEAAASARGDIGRIYQQQGLYKKALECHTYYLETGKKLGNINMIATAHGNISLIYKHQGKLDLALEYCLKAVELAKEFGDKLKITIALGNLGNVYIMHGDYSKGREKLLESLEISKELGDMAGVSFCTGALGSCAIFLGNVESALNYLNEWRRLSLDLGETINAAIAIGNIGQIQMQLGKYDEAYECFDEALQCHRKKEFKYGLFYWLIGKADVLSFRNELKEAKTLIREAGVLIKEMGHAPDFVRYHLVKTKIEFLSKTNIQEKSSLVARLLHLCEKKLSNKDWALLWYELHKLTGDSNHLLKAIESNEQMYKETHGSLYKYRLEQLRKAKEQYHEENGSTPHYISPL